VDFKSGKLALWQENLQAFFYLEYESLNFTFFFVKSSFKNMEIPFLLGLPLLSFSITALYTFVRFSEIFLAGS
jgi:hypothetical protein